MKLENLTIQTYFDPRSGDVRVLGPTESIFTYSPKLVKTYQERYCAITFCINPQEDTNRRGIQNTKEFLRIGLDIDGGKEGDDPVRIQTEKQAILNKLRRLPLLPTYIIESKNGYYAIWEFDTPRPLKGPEREEMNKDYCIAVKQLTEATGLKSEGDSISRVLRLPGTYHYKNPNDPFLVKMIYEGSTVSMSVFTQTYNINVDRDKNTGISSQQKTVLDKSQLERIAEDYGWLTSRVRDMGTGGAWEWRDKNGAGRNNLLKSVFASVFFTFEKKGWNTEDASEMCRVINNSMQEPLDKDEVEYLISAKRSRMQSFMSSLSDGWSISRPTEEKNSKEIEQELPVAMTESAQIAVIPPIIKTNILHCSVCDVAFSDPIGLKNHENRHLTLSQADDIIQA